MFKFFKEDSAESQPDIKKQLENAIVKKDLNAVVDIITKMDRLLIGEKTIFSPQNSYHLDDLKKLLDEKIGSALIYLGDGGISRLVINKEGKKIEIFLSEVSSKRVKEQWGKI